MQYALRIKKKPDTATSTQMMTLNSIIRLSCGRSSSDGTTLPVGWLAVGVAETRRVAMAATSRHDVSRW